MENKTLTPIENSVLRVAAGGPTEGAYEATGGGPPAGTRVDPPDPEVPEQKPRRRFTAAYKLRILEEADKCTVQGQIGALLRREGLYSSNLSNWRKQRQKGILAGISPKKRGRKPAAKNPLAKTVASLENENRRLQAKLRKAEIIIEAQKKISEILNIEQNLEEIENGK